jgi:REP element-mobilizing transposase RayT
MERTGRIPRIHTPNTIHHVMVRGNNRQRIFFDEKYFEEFLEITRQNNFEKNFSFVVLRLIEQALEKMR